MVYILLAVACLEVMKGTDSRCGDSVLSKEYAGRRGCLLRFDLRITATCRPTYGRFRRKDYIIRLREFLFCVLSDFYVVGWIISHPCCTLSVFGSIESADKVSLIFVIEISFAGNYTNNIKKIGLLIHFLVIRIGHCFGVKIKKYIFCSRVEINGNGAA